MPDNFFDEVMPQLSGAEVKVLLYIFRRTFGFKKQSDNISLSQMVSGIRRRDGEVLDRGTGLGKTTVVGAINRLIARGMVRKIKRRSEAKGDQPSSYEPVLTDEPISPVEPVFQIGTGGVPKTDTGVSQIGTHKKQRDKKQQDNTVNGGGTLLKALPDLEQEPAETDDVLAEILDQMPDAENSERFYRLTARKVPSHVIRQALSEIRTDGARHPGKLFTHKMQKYALERLKRRVGSETA